MKLKEAIEVLKKRSAWIKQHFEDSTHAEAIDTVIAHLNTGNKTGLDDSLQEKSIEQPDNQEGISNKKDRLYTAKDMDEFAEWMSFKEYSYHPKAKIWTYGMPNRKTTAQLRELWEERGEK